MKTVLTFLLSVLSFYASARRYYCDVVLSKNGLFSPAVAISIHTGDDRRLYQYLKRQDQDINHKQFSSPVDVINYMAKLGWDLAAVDGVVKDVTNTHMYFSKELNDEEL